MNKRFISEVLTAKKEFGKFNDTYFSRNAKYLRTCWESEQCRYITNSIQRLKKQVKRWILWSSLS